MGGDATAQVRAMFKTRISKRYLPAQVDGTRPAQVINILPKSQLSPKIRQGIGRSLPQAYTQPAEVVMCPWLRFSEIGIGVSFSLNDHATGGGSSLDG